MFNQVNAFHSKSNRWPANLEEVIKFAHLGTNYLVDGWGRALVYVPADYRSGKQGTVTSYGRDGVPGGDGDDADVDGVFW